MPVVDLHVAKHVCMGSIAIDIESALPCMLVLVPEVGIGSAQHPYKILSTQHPCLCWPICIHCGTALHHCHSEAERCPVPGDSPL